MTICPRRRSHVQNPMTIVVLAIALVFSGNGYAQNSANLVVTPNNPAANQVFEIAMHASGGCTSAGVFTSERQSSTISILHVVPSSASFAGGPCTERILLPGMPVGTYHVQWTNRIEFAPPLVIQLATTVLVIGTGLGAATPIALPVLNDLFLVVLAGLVLLLTIVTKRS